MEKRFYHTRTEYEMQLHLHHQKSRLTEHDVVRMKIFNESDFVEVSLKSFTPMGRSVYKLRFESKKIGTVEGIQFLDNHEVDPMPEWIINNVRIMCNGFSYRDRHIKRTREVICVIMSYYES